MESCNIDISVIVPVYNSAETISELASRIVSAMIRQKLAYEIILIDDCSADNSWAEIKKVCQINAQITGARLAINTGQWCASIAGIGRARGKYIVTIDDDLEYDPRDILKLYDTIISGNYQVVFGTADEKYHLQGKSRSLSRWRNNLLNALWNKGRTDSFKIFDRTLVFDKNAFLLKEHFEAFITHHLERKHWGYCSVNFNKRISGASNHTFIKKMKLFFLFTSHHLMRGRATADYSIVEEVTRL